MGRLGTRRHELSTSVYKALLTIWKTQRIRRTRAIRVGKNTNCKGRPPSKAKLPLQSSNLKQLLRVTPIQREPNRQKPGSQQQQRFRFWCRIYLDSCQTGQ